MSDGYSRRCNTTGDDDGSVSHCDGAETEERASHATQVLDYCLFL